jgi:putative aldouronate transport system substrate-binding protein
MEEKYMKEKKLLVAVFIAMLAIAAVMPVYAGGGGQKAAGSGGAREITFVIFGDKTDRMAQYVANDLPKLLAEKGLNIKVDLQVLPWTEYGGPQVELRYASGEDFATWTDMPILARCAGKGYLLDITDLIDKHAPNVRKEIDPASFDSFSLNGRNYALPIGNKPNASEWYAFAVRQDLLEETGMKEIATIEDLEKYYTEAKRRHPDYFGYGEGGPNDTYGAVRALSGYIGNKNLLFLNELVITDASANDDKVWSYLESDEFRNYAAIARRWNQMGIIDQQVLSDATIVGSKWNAGQAFFRNGNAGRPWEDLATVRAAAPNAKLRDYFIGETRNRPKISRGTYSTAFQISANAKHPEAYLEVINLLYSDEKTYNYMVYGVEGLDYTLDARGKLATRPTSQVLFPEWAANLSKWQRFESIIDDTVINDYKRWNDGAILQKDIGFIFDLEPVKVEYAQIQAVVNEYVPQIVWGFADYAAAYPELQRRLKNAGIDKYIAEYQKQFSAWYNTKK